MCKGLRNIFMCACFTPQRLNVACRAWLLECKSKKDLADFIKFAKCMRREFDKRKMRGSARRFRHWYDVAVRLYLMGGDFINTAYSATDFANCNAAPGCKILVQGDVKTHNYKVYKIGVRSRI